MHFRFQKKEKLKSKKLIEQLFAEGTSVSKYPLKLIFLQTDFDDGILIKAGFVVPKKKFKKATDRNRIKRLMKEAYRLNKGHFFNNLPTSFAFMFLYLGKEEADFQAISKTMEQLLIKFQKQTQL